MGQGQDTTLTGGGKKSGGTLADLLKAYDPGFGDLTTAYLAKQGKGVTDLPSFQELYGSYKNVAEQETDRQTAKLTEAFGSQGGRYSSDLLRGQGQLRRELTNDLTGKAGQFKLDLYDRQIQNYLPFLNAETQNRQLAMNYLNDDFLRRTSPPPLLGPASQHAQSSGPPNTVVV